MAEPGLADLLEKEAIRALIQETATLLDREELDGWIGLFAEDSEYALVTYGPEIKAAMTWWKSKRDDLKNILDEVPQHVRDPGHRRHLVTPVSISVSRISPQNSPGREQYFSWVRVPSYSCS